ncbi:MAG TPA: DMT family transporter [Gaiellaceae bacterium]|nr:DMT family transporter [Gaiellaceae bacterium]
MSTRSVGIGLAFVAATISGFAIFVNSYAVKHFDDATVYTTAKNGVAGVLLILLASVASRPGAHHEARRFPTTARGQGALVAVAVVGGSVPFVLFFEGLARASATQAAFIQKTLVVWVALLAVPLLGERLRPAHVAAIVLLVAGQAALVGDAGTIAFGSGEAMILAATLLWSLEVVLAKWLLRSLAPSLLAAARLGLGTIILLGYVLLSGRWDELAGLSGSQWEWALLTGVILTGYVSTWYAALARAPAVDVTAVLVFGAIVTAVLDAGFRSVPLDLLGVVLITVGVALVSRIAVRPRPAPAPA